jgi:hypothetical protein
MVEKILFFLTNDYTHYCLAHTFQKKYDSKMYAISEVTSRPKKFFQNQKLVNFENIWFLHDHIKKNLKPDLVYLKEFEKKYKINLWKLVQNERIFLYFKDFYKFSREDILSILEQECRFFEKILEEIKPKFFFTRLPSLHHQELIYQMCKNTGVKIIAMNYTIVGKKCMLSQEHQKLDHVLKLEDLEHNNRNFEDLQKYIHSSDLLKQIDEKLVKPGNKIIDNLRSMKSYLIDFDTKNTNTHYTYYGRTKFKVFSYYLKDWIKTKIRKSFIDKNLKMKLNTLNPFVYFPIHIEMERSLLLGAPYFINQIEVIRSVAKSLPINFNLVIKEHPGQVMRGWRSRSEYQEIMDIPNVVLMHPNFSREKLYQDCSLVFSIAGTAGFEAACYGKPTITLVDLNYSLLPSVEKLNNFDELPELIKKMIKIKIEPKVIDQFLTLLEYNMSDFDWSAFSKKLSEKFLVGSIQDTEISVKKMEEFLEENNDMLKSFADDHVKKIEWFNSNI